MLGGSLVVDGILSIVNNVAEENGGEDTKKLFSLSMCSGRKLGLFIFGQSWVRWKRRWSTYDDPWHDKTCRATRAWLALSEIP